jgi:hypothetical protein
MHGAIATAIKCQCSTIPKDEDLATLHLRVAHWIQCQVAKSVKRDFDARKERINPSRQTSDNKKL